MFSISLTASLHSWTGLETQFVNCSSASALETLSTVQTLGFIGKLRPVSSLFETTITRKYNFSELINLPLFSHTFITDNQALRFLSEMTALSRADVAKVLTALRNLIFLSVQNRIDKIYLLAFDIQFAYKDDSTFVLISRF